MNLSDEMAAIFFLYRLDTDKELSNLCQTLYDLKPFTLSAVTDRVAFEHSRRKTDAVLLLADKDKQKQIPNNSPNFEHQSSHRKNQWKDRKKASKNKHFVKDDPNKRLDILEKMIASLQTTITSSSMNAVTENTNVKCQPSDSEAFVLYDLYSLGQLLVKGTIYLHSGAGRTVVNDLSLLTNPVLVNKQINTFSQPVKVTLEGTLIFKGVHLHPVYYVPGGPVNLLSVSQLCDHGLKMITKSNTHF
ncbi:hypothetical protein O181_036342 [Austropuccinia psidii MF-1]|uniref:Uncharacterized protein n=1 Tax=Austropuccinia psidii MF-1 TaxID=1389203 RepID=A0A9Q3D6Y2_9BASI|nr:hypothetical protein [Austropuccinia psidii MF-1]